MKIIAGNFKSNKKRAETLNYLKELDSRLDSMPKELLDSRQIYIFPAISSLIENNFAHLNLGAQNAHFAEGGAFTGEISLSHLREFNVQTILIGHSERRNIFNESDEIIAKKFAFFAEQNFKIFLCVGENLAIRKSNKTKDFLRTQLEKINLDYMNLIIAYEPIWAIGTGQNASLEQIGEVYEFLQNITKKPILYGGSVNADNAKAIISATDGVLVGGASLEVASFHQIIIKSQGVKK